MKELDYSNSAEGKSDIENPGGKNVNQSMIYTVYKIKISKAYKGKYKENDIIEVAQVGGEKDGKKVTSSEFIDLKKTDNTEYLFFLNSPDELPSVFVSPYQGCYEYDKNNKEYRNISDDKTFEISEEVLSNIK